MPASLLTSIDVAAAILRVIVVVVVAVTASMFLLVGVVAVVVITVLVDADASLCLAHTCRDAQCTHCPGLCVKKIYAILKRQALWV